MLSALKKGMEVGQRVSLKPSGYVMLYLTALDFGHTPEKDEKIAALKVTIAINTAGCSFVHYLTNAINRITSIVWKHRWR